MYKDLRKTKFWDKLPIGAKMEFFLEQLMNKNKLYSIDSIAKRLNCNRNALRNVIYDCHRKRKIYRIEIDGLAYYGDKKLIQKIKGVLLE